MKTKERTRLQVRDQRGSSVLDPEVAKWLRENVPPPTHGRNYHQYLSANFGLRKLLEHIWMLIGMAKTLEPGQMPLLRRRMAEMKGKIPIQMTFYLPPPKDGK